jgi:hypothetical protein
MPDRSRKRRLLLSVCVILVAAVAASIVNYTAPQHVSNIVAPIFLGIVVVTLLLDGASKRRRSGDGA